MKAFSPNTGRLYASFEELVEAEANGYVVVLTSERPNTAPLVIGPFDDKKVAERARTRLARRVRIDERPHKVHTYIRVLWKEKT